MARTKKPVEERIALMQEAIEKQKAIVNREKGKLVDLNQEYAALLREKRDKELNELCDFMELTGLSVNQVTDIVKKESIPQREEEEQQGIA